MKIKLFIYAGKMYEIVQKYERRKHRVHFFDFIIAFSLQKIFYTLILFYFFIL